jgi:hypothetical protein
VTSHTKILEDHNLLPDLRTIKISITKPANPRQPQRWIRFNGALPWYRKIIRVIEDYRRTEGEKQKRAMAEDLAQYVNAFFDIKPAERGGERKPQVRGGGARGSKG